MSVLKSATAELYPTPAEKVEQKELCLESKICRKHRGNFSLHWAPKLQKHPQKLLTLQWRQKWGEEKLFHRRVSWLK